MAATVSRTRRKQEPELEPKSSAIPAKLQESLEQLTVAELKAVISFSEAKVQEKSDGERKALIEETQRRASELGLTVRDLFGEVTRSSTQKRKAGRTAKFGGSLPVKYQGPQPGDTWSGRGRKPVWAKGLDSDQLEKYLVQAK